MAPVRLDRGRERGSAVGIEIGSLVCRCLPLGIVATVWVAAKTVDAPPADVDRKWFMSADGKLRVADTYMVYPPISEPLSRGETRERCPGPALADAR
jgi:hypothetical protein